MEPARPWGTTESPFVEIGGETRVRELAEAFYDRIETESPVLRSMLPRNTSKTREKFFMYLTGWMGGPPLYEMKWGHPRLRMRHMPFPIGEYEAEEWMRCMRLAMTDVELSAELQAFLDVRFAELAEHMRNTETVPPGP